MRVRKSKLLGLATVAVLAISAGGCSILPEMPDLPTAPDWVDPTTWFGGDSANAPDNGQTPDLAALPDKPEATQPDDRQQVAESLASDRTNAKYSADSLRGGTEASAAPPPVVAVASADTDSDSDSETLKTRKTGAATASEAPRVASVDRSIAREPKGTAMAGTLPATATGVAMAPPPEPVVQTAALPEPATAKPASRVAAATDTVSPPPGAQPVLPPTRAVPMQVASISPTDAALGFKPSSAPPLDASVSQFVAAPIIDRYRQTAANAGMTQVPTMVASNNRPAKKLHRPAGGVAMGGPEKMTGAVVANLDVLQPSTSVSRPSVYANSQGLPASAVVFFPGDRVSLNSEARAEVRSVIEQYRANGGQGYIRVVGHSSSRTSNMSVARHMDIVFRKSQQRATAVAQAIIREGIPADKVLVEAVGDSQPVYYESMPKGEDGNRRAEIFLQS
jgi:outer membrane protein OmpA-like peptidoglycan-associated protein